MLRKLMLFAAVVSLAGLLAGQQSMNNASVIKLAKAGLSDDVIISKINASPAAFDTSTDGLIGLKSAGVKDKVVAAIVVKAASTDPASARVSSTKIEAAAVPSAPQAAAGPFHSTDGKIRVYVTDHPLIEPNELDQDEAYGKTAPKPSVAAQAPPIDDAKTVEVQADLVRACPSNVVASDNPDKADFVLVFRRRDGETGSFFALGNLKSLALSAGAKVDGASLFQTDGDLVYSTKQLTFDKAIRDLCAHIPSPSPAAM